MMFRLVSREGIVVEWSAGMPEAVNGNFLGATATFTCCQLVLGLIGKKDRPR